LELGLAFISLIKNIYYRDREDNVWNNFEYI
jgi:hypothetical protein